MGEPSTSRDDLADLLSRAGKGDSAALTDLLRRYESRVRLAARALLRSPLRQALDSVDLVQSVHRALLPGLRDGRYTFSDEGQLLALAVTVLRHKVQRAAQRKRPSALDPDADPVDRTVPPPSSRAESDDLLAHILGEVDGLDRRALELLAQGYSTVEIAAALECTPAVLRARLSRARSRLRDSGLSDQV
ncbi:RNA polymerase sigma factor [Gemmata sp.]|uniref:RNA polymerase sigma factor n=1 Tax=Gemmata sp. TaxID=1914242 RepID=UPI003F722CC1